MRNIHRNDPWTLAVMIITTLLFVASLFTKGFTHELLLEAGVFLVSVKLIIMAYKNSQTDSVIQEELREIKAILTKQDRVSAD